MKAFLKPVLGALALGLSAAPMAQNVTISVASFPDLDRGIKLAIPLYKKLHPNVEIKLTSLAYADHHTAMTTALATGANLPDVMAVDMGFIGKFAESGGMEDLAKAPYNALQYRDKVARFTYPLAMSGQGVMVGMPVDIGPGALFYRKDLLDKVWNTKPTVRPRQAARPSSSRSNSDCPKISTRPLVGMSNPAIRPSSVDLPDPDAPTMASVAARGTSKLTESRMVSQPSASRTRLVNWSTIIADMV